MLKYVARASPAMRGRGLKHAHRRAGEGGDEVARHARAWIETPRTTAIINTAPVARHARAWIETSTRRRITSACRVARHARAWIERVQEPLDCNELLLLYGALTLMYRVMLLLDIPTGMRRGEILAMQWSDFDFEKKTMKIHKSIWKQHLGPVKTAESERVMPLDDDMIADLLEWRAQTKYGRDEDWVFASSRMRGKQPLWPEAVIKNHIRPAAKAVGIRKHVTWHTFRHTFSTLLMENGEDVKTVQSLMRHANPGITMGIYTHAIDEKKRLAQAKVVQVMLPKRAAAGESA